jgi:hypothetical protein
MSRFSESVEHLRMVRMRSKEQYAFTEHMLGITHPNAQQARRDSFIDWYVGRSGQFLGREFQHTADWAVALKPAVTPLGMFTVRHTPIPYSRSQERISQLVEVNGHSAEAIHQATTVLASADMHERLWVPGKQDITAEDLRSIIVVTNEVLRYHDMPIYQRPH